MKSYQFRTLLALLIVSAVGFTFTGRGVAQDATPPPKPISKIALASGMPVDAAGKLLLLERITIIPGAAIPTHTHPGSYAMYVDSGQFGFAVIKGEAQLLRAGSTTLETVAAGTEVILQPGDSIFEDHAVHSARNAGDTDLILLTASLLAADQPGLQPTNDEGTPVS
jgi:quercetin dioxygenase-like cupin family protein